jgi:hypothetical protein
MTSLQNFLISYVLLLAIGPVIIIGWYAITRGRIEYQTDGTAYQTGKLFKGWHFFWTAHKTKDVRLGGQSLILALLKLQRELPIKDWHFEVHRGNQFKVFGTDVSELQKNGLQIQHLCNARLVILEGEKFGLVGTQKIYKFPEWLRDPLSECPTCMASVYGSLIYWIVVYYAGKERMFAWVEGGLDWPWPHVDFWIFYCIGCAFINTVMAKKL